MPPFGSKNRWAVVKGTNIAKGKSGTAPSRKASAVASRKATSRNVYPKHQGSCLTQTRVYVLELRGGFVYVGKTSRSVRERLSEHMSKSPRFLPGAAFTKLHPPTGRLLPRLGNLEGDGDGPERDETLRQMHSRGAQCVRGWKYVRPGPLSTQELAEIEGNIREVFDLCRRCGQAGHFTMQCGRKSKGILSKRHAVVGATLSKRRPATAAMRSKGGGRSKKSGAAALSRGPGTAIRSKGSGGSKNGAVDSLRKTKKSLPTCKKYSPLVKKKSVAKNGSGKKKAGRRQ